MRDQYYADRKDVLKWTVTLHEAEQAGATTVLYVALMRPDDGNANEPSAEGMDFEEPPQAHQPDQRVVEFFGGERVAFGLGGDVVTRPENRRVDRVVGFCPDGIVIKHISAPYRWNQVEDYFQKHVGPAWDALAKDVGPIVVLVDPDTGLPRESNPVVGRLRANHRRHKQVNPVLLRSLWQKMRDGDVLVLAQWPFNENNGAARWDTPRMILCEIIETEAVEVQLGAFGDVGFLVVERRYPNKGANSYGWQCK